ncbi:hypothetical protein DNK06_06690 [Pseudomonas daroniae]|uniref:DUF3298 domain-containing protein n=1 Tax=Phytopseudomonas daroniae TaxID=2487519 RepID=A0A4Q9QNJ1_9GAMM|nr:MULTISPECIES: hypothetical protein [Pseudomonas]TBU81463.1 hypothetical protein DNK06_06690 [Pseudomonas daroniae]TBU84372.1 hypothetical protein DNK31_08485 [Pseudomonas sp. FRB 228]TBU89834.1 hypothetical protein DNJ99_14865 [Pseudomonas daroniae]
MRLLLLPLLAIAVPALADVRIDDLTAKRSDWETYRFPLLVGDSPAIGRINTFLHALELQALPGRFAKSPFENVQPKEGEIWGVNSLDYQVLGQGPGYLSLSIDGESTGAYTSQSSRSYNFDLASGRPIGLPQLLTPEGLLRLQSEVQGLRAKRMEDFLKALPPSKPGEPESLSEDEQWLEGQRNMYSYCLDTRRDTGLGYDRVQLGNDRLTLIAESCANHASRALDDLGEFPNSFSYRALNDDLSPYGRCLLLEQRGDCALPANTSAQGVYHGTLGRYPITLVLEYLSAGHRLSASYFYDKHAKRIELGGEHQQDFVTLYENSEPPARFELEFQADGSLKGTWQQGGKPALDVQLTP